MNNSFETKTELVRLVENAPLTLVCSALADFLWDDFVRDARPSVKYLIEKYDIKQLSRFGKEVFERLYNADNVNWLVSEEDYEDYFRKKCDGEQVEFPTGYKPENGFWWSIMSELSQAAAWRELLKRSYGSQFNSGNNAINVLNELSEYIEKLLESQEIDIHLLTQSGEELEQLRQKFREAIGKGDKEGASKARLEGKELNQKLAKEIEKAKQKIQAQVDNIVDKAVKQSDDVNENINNMYGDNEGSINETSNLSEKRELAKKLENNKHLREIAKKLGAIKRALVIRKRQKKVTASYEAITGARYGNDITKAFPSEISLASTEEGKALFALKYSQKTLFIKDYTAKASDIAQGPIVLYVDVSGSMLGECELWSKAVMFVIAEKALKERRNVHIYLFDVSIRDELVLEKTRKNNRELLDLAGRRVSGGGTSFNSVVSHAVYNSDFDERADILMITDGHSDVSTGLIQKLNEFKSKTGSQWSTICINTSVPSVCRKFSDEVFSVDIQDKTQTADTLIRCVR